MTSEEYEAYVALRCKPYTDVNYCVIALNGEAGEVAEWYKKFILRGNTVGNLSVEDLKGELGDVLFYLTRLASLHGWSLNDVMEAKRAKLDQRVKEGMKQIA